MQAINEWSNAIFNQIGKERKVILIAGASGSGKSYSADFLKNFLEKKGLKVLSYSMDNYYIGLSRALSRQAAVNFNLSPHSAIIDYILMKNTKDLTFPQKFSEKNYDRIQSELELLFGVKIGTNIAKCLVNESNKINFDEPGTVDIEKFTNDLNDLLDEKTIKIPNYNFALCEPTGEKEINGADYDCFIAEGIFALNPKVISAFEKDKIVTAAIRSDLKSLLARRLNRDIKLGRSYFTAEKVLLSYLDQALPSYIKYIYPSFENAKFVLEAGITDIEMEKRDISNQVKYLAPFDINKKLNELNAYKSMEINQRDFFLDDKFMNSKLLIRLREENGAVNKLTFKEITDNCIKAVDEYNLNISLSTNELVRKFTDSGFEISQVIKKKREIFNLYNDRLKLDTVEGIGKYIELERDNKQTFDKLRTTLKLKNPIIQSYYELSKTPNKQINLGRTL